MSQIWSLLIVAGLVAAVAYMLALIITERRQSSGDYAEPEPLDMGDILDSMFR